jgi:hypothetical protein
MRNDQEKELEKLIDRELRRLPELPAPETLVHRVMLAVHQKARRPWWQRPWLAWPFAAQLISLAVLLLCAGTVSYLLGAAWSGVNVTSLPGRVAESFEWLRPIWTVTVTLLNAAAVVIRGIGQQALLIGAGCVLAAYFACVALGTVCYRVACHKA